MIYLGAMVTATVKEIKTALSERSEKELMELCLHLSRFKKENKELLTYLLFEAQDESGYIQSVKADISEAFMDINMTSVYYIKKSVRKILRSTQKYIRYSKIKTTEIEVLMHFVEELDEVKQIRNNTTMQNLRDRQIQLIQKAIGTLHEDLQYDYRLQLERLTD